MKELTLTQLKHPKTLLEKLYHKKLPKRGWAGVKTKIEKDYIKWAKQNRPTLLLTHPPLVNRTPLKKNLVRRSAV